MTSRRAVYPGTFDPITAGHVDILTRALAMFDEVIVTLATNPRKQPLFSLDERIAFIRGAIDAAPGRLEITAFDGLLAPFCAARGACAIVRGLRTAGDLEYELPQAHMNRRLAPTVDTVFLLAGATTQHVSSSLIKEVASLGGDVAGLVPPAVEAALIRRFGPRRSPPAGPSQE
jgi:pantetheine-phosphate adenylyltransferase